LGIPGFRIEREGAPEVVVLSIVGRINPLDLPVVEEAGNELISGGATRVVVDFSETEQITSTGMGLLLYYRHVLAGRDGCLLLAAPSDSVLRMLQSSNLDRVFKIYANRQEAVAAAERGEG
jgi:anti-sigma B factor antagonist